MRALRGYCPGAPPRAEPGLGSGEGTYSAVARQLVIQSYHIYCIYVIRGVRYTLYIIYIPYRYTISRLMHRAEPHGTLFII